MRTFPQVKRPKIASGKKDTPRLSIFVSVRLVSFVAYNKGIVSRVASMVCRMSILRLWLAAVLNSVKNSMCRCVEFRYPGPFKCDMNIQFISGDDVMAGYSTVTCMTLEIDQTHI